ncbi:MULTISPECIES: 8-oxo-dGTP diphosphatase [Sporomusa]|jgi:8-oxo-dGTP diphosphatase|uniref:Oxidized purine nucleoside triphosphate hydrolase n=1 Tax=Sporomusa sphaeroides DSM 2875 TaxID=1337886 RepID=A0ABM9W2D9_9FIRM|nr:MULTISPECIES: 8-oxo-dGTP diphosphatase [Sporomusa]MCM0761460.1 8-oxo-dGTP diphosphatase [Sporomusa sphaeroides DSM 2875]OLS56537.1 8-oxo-dGTP diphosphatase [Sporomusa sphaeroides DSM 2875]CVK19095.1 8-oxo-dGTP diphosphatase [Sporomusa sphaeroides DSM 2875]HML32528.1 8-oxo-dGTP diphosphatase [Sporomusa sphaeroides]
MYSTTLCLPVQGKPAERILLGMKKTGFGCGKYNGFGGKIEDGETPAAAAVRELAEECGLKVQESDLEDVGKLMFSFPDKPELEHDVYVYIVRNWQGEPEETTEMKPVWFDVPDIPYKEMWADDSYWLPAVLKGKKVTGSVVFSEDQEAVDYISIRTV